MGRVSEMGVKPLISNKTALSLLVIFEKFLCVESYP
jgi:hypothetical protein